MHFTLQGKVSTSSEEEVGTPYSPALTVFETTKHLMNTVTLVVDIEELWLKNLAKLGARTSILFEGLNDEISAPRCIIKLHASNSRNFWFLIAIKILAMSSII